MSQQTSNAPARLNRDASSLVSLAQAFQASGSRVEDIYWESLLGQLLVKLMQNQQEEKIEQALEHLRAASGESHDLLIEQAETHSESMRLTANGQTFDALLVLAPIAAWSRFNIPFGPLSTDKAQALRQAFAAHIASDQAAIAVAPKLYSLDQMPRNFSRTRLLLNQLANTALDLPPPRGNALLDAEIPPLLADTRYLVFAIVVPEAQTVFKWQQPEAPSSLRGEALASWHAATAPVLANLLPGCAYEVLLPDAYYVTHREADKSIRPLSLEAAVSWLEVNGELSPSELSATIALCGEQEAEEYRIGFARKNSREIVYGCVWPLFDKNEQQDQEADLEQIVRILNKLGVLQINKLAGLLPLDFCEDCGSPYFPTSAGELVHAEPPQEALDAPAHFH
ncbi:MAG: DUF2863 family protein [Pigmentiphaga sp.]|nr:DUF2863 family protein [Pigmentiphaga sp.]